MGYTKTTWVDGSTPAINATNLNKIEQGIYDNDQHIGELSNLETTTQANVVGAINELEGRFDYSTNEIRVGTWINSKPVYRKVVNKSVSSGSSSFPKSDVSSDMDQVLSIRGFVIQSSGNVAIIPYDADSTDKLNIFYRASDSTFQVRAGSQYGAGNTYIIIEYTKSTD